MEPTMERRRFLTRISVALSSAVAADIGVPVLGFLVSPLIRKAPRVWRSVGPVDGFKMGETVSVAFEDAPPLPWAGVTARSAAWLRREDATRFTAFTVHCTGHLGVPRAVDGERGESRGASAKPAAERAVTPAQGRVKQTKATLTVSPILKPSAGPTKRPRRAEPCG